MKLVNWVLSSFIVCERHHQLLAQIGEQGIHLPHRIVNGHHFLSLWDNLYNTKNYCADLHRHSSSNWCQTGLSFLILLWKWCVSQVSLLGTSNNIVLLFAVLTCEVSFNCGQFLYSTESWSHFLKAASLVSFSSTPPAELSWNTHNGSTIFRQHVLYIALNQSLNTQFRNFKNFSQFNDKSTQGHSNEPL